MKLLVSKIVLKEIVFARQGGDFDARLPCIVSFDLIKVGKATVLDLCRFGLPKQQEELVFSSLIQFHALFLVCLSAK